MATSAFDQIGAQLHDFLMKQLAPPPGATNVLGFLGSGIAVEPDSFLSQGAFNPARVNAWLDIVAEPLAAVGLDDNRVDPAPWTAYSLMDAVCNQSAPVAPPGSDAQANFAHVKSRAMEGLGGATTVATAPLDWYDPAHLADWPTCSLTSDATTASGSETSTPPTPGHGRPILWGWRTLSAIHVVDPAPGPLDKIKLADRAGLAEKIALASPPSRPVAPTFRIASRPAIMTELTSGVRPFAHLQIADTAALAPERPAAAMTFDASRLATVVSRGDLFGITANGPAPASPVMRVSDRLRIDQSLLVSREIASVANGASTSTVNSSSLSISLKYLVVQLSRAPWWSDFLLTLDNWYIPGLRRGALVDPGDAGRAVGVPIALVLTSNVRIEASWSESDRAQAAASTHLGPWAMGSFAFTQSDQSGRTILTIPGTQAIAGIYRTLPVLPPQSDPALPPA